MPTITIRYTKKEKQLKPLIDKYKKLKDECDVLFDKINAWRWMSCISNGRNYLERKLREYKKNILKYSLLCDEIDKIKDEIKKIDSNFNFSKYL